MPRRVAKVSFGFMKPLFLEGRFRESLCGCSLLRCVSVVDRRVREKGGVLSLQAVSGGSKSSPFSEKVHSAPVHFSMIFKKVILIRKNDRLTHPFIADTCFPAVTDVFFLRSSIRSKISLPICLWLAKVGPEFG